MKAIVAYGPGHLRIEEREPMAPDADQVQIRVAYGGICGSDSHYYRDGRVGAFAIQEPLVLGHEIAGYVFKDGRAAAIQLRP